jgi:DNA-binding HxlR family transcriptional regulator
MDATHTDVRTTVTDHTGCRAVADTLSRIGDKWTVMVVGSLSEGPLRYNELNRAIDGISQRMLTLTLKGLEQDGLVTRTLYPTIPPRVEYELTDMGRTLTAPLQVLYQWAQANLPKMAEARLRYEDRQRAEAALLQGVHRSR